jgi:predicted RNA-binding protein with PIN domain
MPGLGNLPVVPGSDDIPDRALQAALEFAVGIAAVSAKQRLPLPFPPEMKPFLKLQRLPASALATVRSALEADGEFLRRLGLVATGELVDPIGMLWLTRPDEWESQVADLLAQQAAEREAADEASELRREQRRREAAETAAMRARIEVGELKDALARERDAVAVLTNQSDRVSKELKIATARVKELESGLRKRTAGAKAVNELADAVTEELATLRVDLAAAQAARDAALTVRAGEVTGVDVVRLRALLHEAVALTGEVPAKSRSKAKRAPLPIPGGLYGNSEAAAEHLLRAAGVMVLVDGYNVAKLGWPDLTLAHQRDRAIALCEDVARRWGTELHIVFDGADVVGAHAPQRRLVRVSYSPAGVIADDVLRAQVSALDPTRPVVVVTNDQEVQTDVKSAGANVVTSDAFLAVARR